MSRISRQVRNAALTRLSDVSTGFNPRLTLALADAGLVLPYGFVLPIDFSPASLNFFQADIVPADIDTTSASTYPAMVLFSNRSRDAKLEKFNLFAGPVFISIKFFVSWINSRLLPDFETFGDCVEEAMYGTFNDPALRDWGNALGVVWNGDISFERSRLTQDAKNWLQSYHIPLTFELHVAT